MIGQIRLRRAILTLVRFTILLCAAAFCSTACCDEATELDKAIREFKVARSRDELPPYNELKLRGDALLQQYSAPDQRGLICFEFVELFQAINAPKQGIVEYASMGLQGNLTPAQRAILYSRWGDSLFQLQPDAPLPERRRLAVAVYLEGLNDVRRSGAMAAVPALTVDPLFLEMAKTKEQRADLARRRKEAKALRYANSRKPFWFEDIELHHDILVRSTVQLCATFPYAADELRELAAEKLDDPAFVDSIVGVTQARIDRKIVRRARPPGQPLERISRARLLFVIANVVVVAAIMLWLGIRKWFVRRKPIPDQG
jgi:hypothetical protein